MISLRELVKAGDSPDVDALSYLHILHFHLNFLRRLTPFPWVINRGYSTPEEQIAIYQAKGEEPKMGSLHLFGAAADVADPEGTLKKWVLDHLHYVEMMNLYMEDFDSTGGLSGGWVHFQILPPPSGNRFFLP